MRSSLSLKPSKAKPEPLARRLLAWWDGHRRDLPWRARPGETTDAYAVWLSEILLQQTTVAVATPYFVRFLSLWPRVEALAAAPIEEVMRAFAGLGYYSRARNMHACAQEIARRGGRFPRTEAELRALPGIGAYTSAAIAAIAFNEPASPVDGNIARIIARLDALPEPVARSRRTIDARAAALTPKDRPGDFAQALMDLGATICRPRNPDCPACPLRGECAAAASGDGGAFPRPLVKPKRPLRKGAAFFVQRADGGVLLRTRPAKGLLGGTVELPGSVWSSDFEPADEPEGAPFPAAWRRLPGVVEQAFTHFTLQLTLYAAPTSRGATRAADCYWVAQADLERAALSGVMAKAIAHAMRHPIADRAVRRPVNTRRDAPSPKRSSGR